MVNITAEVDGVHEGTPEHVTEEEEQNLLQEKGMVEV